MAITRRLIIALGVVLAAHFLDAQAVFACDCIGPGPVSEAFWKTPVVFVGRVEAVGPIRSASTKGARLRTRFRVTEALRGTKARQIEIFGYETDCDLRFSPGEDWLIYAFTRRDDRRLTTTSCSRSRPLSEAAEDLAYGRNATVSVLPLSDPRDPVRLSDAAFNVDDQGRATISVHTLKTRLQDP